MKRILIWVLPLMLIGCDKSPISRFSDTSKGGPTGVLSSSADFVVYDDELKTGGGFFLYSTNTNAGDNQFISVSDNSNPIGKRSIKYNWNGQGPILVVPGPNVSYAGFSLSHVIDDNPSPSSAYNTVTPRDLSGAGYGQVQFYARGSLSSQTSLKIEISDDDNDTNTASPACLVLSRNGTDNFGGASCGGTNYVLSNNWQLLTIPVTGAVTGQIKDFFKATFVYEEPFNGAGPGSGGTIYIDQIQFVP